MTDLSSCVDPIVGELKTPSMGDFLWGLESSGWLKHIKAVLDAGVFIAKVIHTGQGARAHTHTHNGYTFQ